MTRYSKQQQPSPEIREDAMAIANGIQRPGQTKEQTKLIAQGIEKGIQLYKKQQKAKAREFNKQSKKQQLPHSVEEITPEMPIDSHQSRLPWILLMITWIGIGIFFILESL